MYKLEISKKDKVEKHKKITAGKIIVAPIKGTWRLFTAPFVLPFKVGQGMYQAVKYAAGKPDAPVHTFEEWYVIKNSNEGILQRNYRKSAVASIIMLIITCITLCLAIKLYYNPSHFITLPMRIVPFIAVLVCLSGYFSNIVACYCIKNRSYKKKLGVFKSIDDIFPNPFFELTTASMVENGEEVEVEVQLIKSDNDKN